MPAPTASIRVGLAERTTSNVPSGDSISLDGLPSTEVLGYIQTSPPGTTTNVLQATDQNRQN